LDLSSDSGLKTVLESGNFAVTAETSPPDAADAATVLECAGCLKGVVDAVNVTDGAGARAHMSALACAAILARNGIEPVLQFTTRDRNLIALQGDLVGAAALDIPNMLCIRGDDVAAGDQPDATSVHDLDSVGLIKTAKSMRDEGRFPSGRAIDPKPVLFIGAADAPSDPGPEFDAGGLLAKIDAGADFVQTQFAFDIDVLKRYMARLCDAGVPERVYYIVGVGPIASAKSARWMNENLMGVHVPEAIIKRLEGAADQKAEGREICVELLQQFQEIDGIHGVHLMGPRQEQTIASIVSESGLRQSRGPAAVAN
jgi:methylenetetrahydrofolate reductase (NADPH)